MGLHAHIATGRVVVDALAWLDRRTAGTVTDLTFDLLTFTAATRGQDPDRHAWAEQVMAWRAARGYVSPDPTDPDDAAVISHQGTRLDTDLWIARMQTTRDGRVAVVLRGTTLPVVYCDTAETADWYDADTVEIRCPAGHGWTWRAGRELLTADGHPATLTAVFGPNLDAPFVPCPYCQSHDAGRRRERCECDGSSWIVCPTCGQRCDVDLPQI